MRFDGASTPARRACDTLGREKRRDGRGLGTPLLDPGIGRTRRVGAGVATDDDVREGRDFYREGSTIVFTAAYHLRRGSCCGNRCRHCPYDHANVPGRDDMPRAGDES